MVESLEQNVLKNTEEQRNFTELMQHTACKGSRRHHSQAIEGPARRVVHQYQLPVGRIQRDLIPGPGCFCGNFIFPEKACYLSQYACGNSADNECQFIKRLVRSSGSSLVRYFPMLNSHIIATYSDADLDRIIQMAWEDRTSFDTIRSQFGLTPGDVIKLMRQQLTANSFKLWRKRTAGRRTKHQALRSFRIGRFRAPGQRD